MTNELRPKFFHIKKPKTPYVLNRSSLLEKYLNIKLKQTAIKHDHNPNALTEQCTKTLSQEFFNSLDQPLSNIFSPARRDFNIFALSAQRLYNLSRFRDNSLDSQAPALTNYRLIKALNILNYLLYKYKKNNILVRDIVDPAKKETNLLLSFIFEEKRLILSGQKSKFYLQIFNDFKRETENLSEDEFNAELDVVLDFLIYFLEYYYILATKKQSWIEGDV